MKKLFTICIVILTIFMFTACEPTVVSPEKEFETPIKLTTSRERSSKGLTTTFESLSIDHYKYRFTYLGANTKICGETNNWITTTKTPNEWELWFTQGEWRFEIEGYSDETTLVTAINTTGYISKISNPLSEIIEELMNSLSGDGTVVFKDLHLPALYADKTNFYVEYILYNQDGTVFSSGTVPMKEVRSGDGVATLDSFQVENVPAGEYVIALQVFEMNETSGLYEAKGGEASDGIIIYPGCRSTVTGTFGDSGNYLNAVIRTFQTATTFTGKVSSDKLETGGNNTYDDFYFKCTADNPTNIRWFVDGIEQTEVLKSQYVQIGTEKHYYYTCPNKKCKAEVSMNDPTQRVQNSWLVSYTCSKCGESYNGSTWRDNEKSKDEPVYGYKDVPCPVDGTETEFTVRLSQMGHGRSGATTHYVECIYTDVEGHTSSSTQEMFVGSSYFPNLGASSIFVMGNGNEIDHWTINLTPDESLSNNGFHTYSSASGDVTVDADTGIWISEGLWVINNATAYDAEGMALIETTNPTKTYINKLNPYINIENVIKSETTETGTIRIRDLKMNSLSWDCNYATGTIDPFKVKTYVTVYKLTDEGKDDDSFSPLSLTIDGCTLLETGKTVSGTSGGKSYSYHNDTYQIVGASTERDFEVPEGTYRVQIKINSGTRNGYKSTYKSGGRTNNSYFSGVTEGDLEVIVNVQAHTTQVITGTLSCNHCLKTDGTI